MITDANIELFTSKFILGLLVFIRISGLFAGAPFFRSNAIPAQMKIFLGVILAISVSSAFWDKQPQVEMGLWFLTFLVLKEFMIGLIIGFSANVVFWGARFAGGIIDFDMGYQTGMLFAMDESSPSLVGEFFELMALMIFLILNGHHYIIQGIYASIKAVPVTTFAVTTSTVELLIRIAASVLIVGIKIAAPVITALFITNLALALLARVAPQTNIFILSFQLKIAVGLLVLLATVPLLVMFMKYFLEGIESDLMKMILTLNPARV